MTTVRWSHSLTAYGEWGEVLYAGWNILGVEIDVETGQQRWASQPTKPHLEEIDGKTRRVLLAGVGPAAVARRDAWRCGPARRLAGRIRKCDAQGPSGSELPAASTSMPASTGTGAATFSTAARHERSHPR